MLTQEAWTVDILGANPPSGAAEAGCKLQLYGEMLAVIISAMYQIPGAPV